MRGSLRIVMLVVAAACGKGKGGDKEAPRQPAFTGPMPVAFGDCAGPTVAFVSGPRPLPFTLEQAAGVWVAATAPHDDPPPPDDDDSGGMGTAMALDEGRMGKQDSTRREGQYKMHKTTDDPELARQQAIEAARSAGILGEAAPEQGGQGGAFASLTGTGDTRSDFDDTNFYGQGYGSGGGGGRGGTRGRTAPVPTISVGQPNAQGDLDKAIIRRFVKRKLANLTYCYEKQLLTKPELAGTVQVQFFISPKGDVGQSTASGVDPEVSSCVAEVIKNIQFPRPKGGGGVQVNYPFIFHKPGGKDALGASAGAGAASAGSAGSSAAALGAGAGAGSAAGSAGGSDASAGSAPGSDGSTARPDSGPPRELYRKPSRGFIDASKYTPGATNPLRAEQAGLTDCFRMNPKHAGAVVVGLSYDTTGAVTAVTVYGIDDAPTNACVVAAAKRIKRTGAGPAAQRCPVAFGDMPLADLPAIDIAATVRFDNKDVATAADLQKVDTKLPDLAAALEARLSPILAASGPIVAVHPPNVIRPGDNTPMKIVYAVISSVLRTGDDFVLAAKHGAAWALLTPTTHPVSFPTVPVPFGTGARWNPIKVHGAISDEELVHLSLLVAQDKRIWIGLSRVNEFQEFPPDATQAEKVLTALKTHKASAFFADRKDIEIAGKPDASYGDVVTLIDAAAKAGFVDWQLTDAGGLAARPSL